MSIVVVPDRRNQRAKQAHLPVLALGDGHLHGARDYPGVARDFGLVAPAR
jgi:hypothetical protein